MFHDNAEIEYRFYIQRHLKGDRGLEYNELRLMHLLLCCDALTDYAIGLTQFNDSYLTTNSF